MIRRRNVRSRSKTLRVWVLSLPLCGLCFIFWQLFENKENDIFKPITLEQLRKQNELVVLTRNAPTTVYQGRQGLDGFEYTLAVSFARFFGVADVRFKFYNNAREIIAALERGDGHLAAAGLTRARMKESHLLFGPIYGGVAQQVVCRRGSPLPQTAEQLVGLRMAVTADSKYEDTLRELRKLNKALTWEARTDTSVEELLEQVWEKRLDCTVADSNIVAVNRRLYPELMVAFAVTDLQAQSWIVAPQAQELLPQLHSWFVTMVETHALTQIQEQYFGIVNDFDYVDIKVFQRRIEERLPALESAFKRAADENDLPWTLLAAVAYQESHWDGAARSPTGVRGMMMLTQETAAEVGVENRLDPVQSIAGGARYLKKLLQRIPDSVAAKDERLWFALAAYNMGMGHLVDARKLAARLGVNPDLWSDMERVLPLLTRNRYYAALDYGYARGNESVIYVKQVRNFLDLLEQRFGPGGS